jgi:alkylation response protein AidB-like acyl-CoA dehydrogenase
MHLDEERNLFRDTIRSFVGKEIEPNVEEWESSEKIPRDLFKRLGQLGFLGLEFPSKYGGGDSDFWMTTILAEELARCRSGGVAFSVMVHTDMSSPWLARLGTEEQQARYLPGIISGDIVCALAITEPSAGSDMASLNTSARQDGQEWVISGAKTFITNGVYGDLYFVAARTNKNGPRHQQLSQFLVERNTPGLTVTNKLSKTGMWASDTAELSFDNVRVPSNALIGKEGQGFYQLAEGLQRERLVAAILSVSASHQAVDDTQLYLSHREAFGAPLSDMQALRHKVANMATQVEAARRLTYHAIEKFVSGKECVKEVSMAKLFATETANRIAYDAVQLHGGYGYIRELPVERFARDYRLWTIAAGTSEVMHEIIAKHIFASDE